MCLTEPLWTERRALRQKKGLEGQRSGCRKPGKMNVALSNPLPVTHPPLYPLLSQPSPLPRGLPSPVRSPDCGRYPRLRT